MIVLAIVLLCPVRPSNSDFPNFTCALCEDDEAGFENVGDSPIVAHVDHDEDFKDGDIIDIDEDIVVQPAQPLPQPKVPTAAQIAAHNLTHFRTDRGALTAWPLGGPIATTDQPPLNLRDLHRYLSPITASSATMMMPTV